MMTLVSRNVEKIPTHYIVMAVINNHIMRGMNIEATSTINIVWEGAIIIVLFLGHHYHTMIIGSKMTAPGTINPSHVEMREAIRNMNIITVMMVAVGLAGALCCLAVGWCAVLLRRRRSRR